MAFSAIFKVCVFTEHYFLLWYTYQPELIYSFYDEDRE